MNDALLARAGYTAAWFERAPPDVALTIRVCATKLLEHGLWDFVAREEDSAVGTMHVTVTDPAALRAALRVRGFAFGGGDDGPWDASERTFGPSLHAKHFDGWPADKVQFHVDRAGLWLARAWWWFPPVPLVQMARHAWHYESYRDVRTLARLVGLDQQSAGADGAL